MRIKPETRESLRDAVEAIQKRVAERAFELFDRGGRAVGSALDDWLAAERETIWKPPIELVEKDGEFLVEAAVAGVTPKDLDVQVTSHGVLIQGNGEHAHRPGEVVHACEFKRGRLFRTVEFPRRVDPDRARTDYQNGLLRVWVPVAEEEVGRKVL